MKRAATERIRRDLERKMVFLVGPRQVGKTWLARELMAGQTNAVYLNWDRLEDRKIIREERWLKGTELLVLDEVHKAPRWKGLLKGIYDTRPAHLSILVTGSARLDLVRQAGPSLAGRFFVHHLMPVTGAELRAVSGPENPGRLLRRGGFPEPFLAEEDRDADRWRAQYVDGLIREDVPDFARIGDLRAMLLLVRLLRERVGTPVSYESLARDLEVAPNTVKKYVGILEALYVVFRVTPYSDQIARSLLKNPKLYFYDTGLVADHPGAQFENHVAVSLLAHQHALSDQDGRERQLHLVRTKEGKEVDFCLVADGRPELLVEAKTAETDVHKPLVTFARALGVPGVQVVAELRREREEGSVTLRTPEAFLGGLST
jgi:predicted AAA+ superfamily ATPase